MLQMIDVMTQTTDLCGVLFAELLGDDLFKDLSPADTKLLDEISESLDLIGQEVPALSTTFDDVTAIVDQSDASFSRATTTAGAPTAAAVARCRSGASFDEDMLSLPGTPFGNETDFREVFADLSAQIEQVMTSMFINAQYSLHDIKR